MSFTKTGFVHHHFIDVLLEN